MYLSTTIQDFYLQMKGEYCMFLVQKFVNVGVPE